MTTTTTLVTRAEVEDLLSIEACLLDEWKLEAWLKLYTDDAEYYVPSADLPANADADKSLFYIADDRLRLQERVTRLMKKSAHAEYPRSRTRHLVTNVRIESQDGEDVKASAAFATFRSKHSVTDFFVGCLRYRLRRIDGALFIREKRCVLDLESLRPQGRISIIL